MNLIKKSLIAVAMGTASTGLIFIPLIILLEKLTENIEPETIVLIGMTILFSLLLWALYKFIKED